MRKDGGKGVDAPVLGVPSIHEANDVDDINGNGASRCFDAHQRSGMDAGDRLPGGDQVAFGDLAMDRHSQPGQGGAKHVLKGVPHALGTVGHALRCGPVHEIRIHEGFEGAPVSLDDHILVESAND